MDKTLVSALRYLMYNELACKLEQYNTPVLNFIRLFADDLVLLSEDYNKIFVKYYKYCNYQRLRQTEKLLNRKKYFTLCGIKS